MTMTMKAFEGGAEFMKITSSPVSALSTPPPRSQTSLHQIRQLRHLQQQHGQISRPLSVQLNGSDSNGIRKSLLERMEANEAYPTRSTDRQGNLVVMPVSTLAAVSGGTGQGGSGVGGADEVKRGEDVLLEVGGMLNAECDGDGGDDDGCPPEACCVFSVPDWETVKARLLPTSKPARDALMATIVLALITIALEAVLLHRHKAMTASLTGSTAATSRAGAGTAGMSYQILFFRPLTAYYYIFILAEVFAVGLLWDAAIHKNSMQLVAFTLFEWCMVTYSGLQIWQHDQLFKDIGIPAEVLVKLGRKTTQMILFSQLGVQLAACLGITLLTWRLYSEFGWLVFRKLGADVSLRKMMKEYRLLFTLLKLDAFFFFGYAIQVVALTDKHWQKGLEEIAFAIPLTAVLTLFMTVLALVYAIVMLYNFNKGLKEAMQQYRVRRSGTILSVTPSIRRASLGGGYGISGSNSLQLSHGLAGPGGTGNAGETGGVNAAGNRTSACHSGGISGLIGLGPGKMQQRTTFIPPFVRDLVYFDKTQYQLPVSSASTDNAEPQRLAEYISDDGVIILGAMQACLPQAVLHSHIPTASQPEDFDLFRQSCVAVLFKLNQLTQPTPTAGDDRIEGYLAGGLLRLYGVDGLDAWLGESGRRATEVWFDLFARGEYDQAWLVGSTVLEQLIVNIIFTLQGPDKFIPFLVRDLLAVPCLTKSVDRTLVRVIKTLMGSPLTLNIRNLLWHGFITPGDQIPLDAYGAMLIVTTMSIAVGLRSSSAGLRGGLEFRHGAMPRSKFYFDQQSSKSRNSDIDGDSDHSIQSKTKAAAGLESFDVEYERLAYGGGGRLSLLVLELGQGGQGGQEELCLVLETVVRKSTFDRTSALVAGEYYLTLDVILDQFVPPEYYEPDADVLRENRADAIPNRLYFELGPRAMLEAMRPLVPGWLGMLAGCLALVERFVLVEGRSWEDSGVVGYPRSSGKCNSNGSADKESVKANGSNNKNKKDDSKVAGMVVDKSSVAEIHLRLATVNFLNKFVSNFERVKLPMIEAAWLDLVKAVDPLLSLKNDK
ncbi:hypothetical protein BGW39_003893 [Mortierella sp. 14UC]|nr:hypothetical protein BGW39_003893 [Mortierella sp. 14UC]